MTRCSKTQIIAIFSIALSFTFIFTAATFAQGVPTPDGLTVSLSNENPSPGKTVTITITNYGADISGAKVSWYVNDKLVKEGIGLNTMDVTAPALGSKLMVSIVAVTPAGDTIKGSATIGSGSVDMIVETDGYVPPLFLGKVPVAYQNNVKIIAIPHLADSSGKEYSPTDLIYDWKKNGTAMADASGYDKQSITIPGNIIPREYTMSVTVSSRTGGYQAVGTALVQLQSPSILSYINDPLYGTLFNKAIGDNLIIGAQKEDAVLVVPFGFNPGNSLSWSINGVAHPELDDKSTVVLRSPDGSGGSSAIHIDSKSTINILQSASSDFTATFKATNDTTLSQSSAL